MRVLVAPDKFKGSLSAEEAAAAIAEGVRRVYPTATVVEFPIADGGEGTLSAAYLAGYQKMVATVAGPTGKPLEAAWGLRQDTSGAVSAVIETATASGLEHMEKTTANALLANSYGSGQLIKAALDAGASEIVVGLGGSAMSDGGLGAALALGLRAIDKSGNPVQLGGGFLADVAAIDTQFLDPRLGNVALRLAVDVNNPLHGPEGAAHVFAPQKGASPTAVERLDAGLRNWCNVLCTATGRQVNVPGAGAAGGFPAAFLALTSTATLEGGFALVAEYTGLAKELAATDLVITGEGSLDAQSLKGKAPIALANAASKNDIKVLAVAGRITVSAEDLALQGVTSSAQLLDMACSWSGVPDTQDAVDNAALYLRGATIRLLTKKA